MENNINKVTCKFENKVLEESFLNEKWLNYIDFRDRDFYLKEVEDFSPNYLFHLGAFTNLEYCERNKEQTYLTNTLSVENAVFVANKLDIPLLFISTAGIFDGREDTYDDWRSKDLEEDSICRGLSCKVVKKFDLASNHFA